MKHLLPCAAAFALACLGWLCIVAAGEIPKLRPALQAEAELTRALVSRQLAETRDALDAQLVDVRIAAVGEIAATRLELARQLGATRDLAALEMAATRGVLETRLASIQGDLVSVARETEADTMARLDETNRILAGSMAPVNETIDQLNETLPLFLDCDHNADCLFNRYVGTARSAEQTSESIARISNDLSILTHKLTEPKPWYRRVIDYAVSAALLTTRFLN
jgi:ABC-type transporter Mla subunit MlaD